MPRWLPKILTRIRALAADHKVRLTLKARAELAALDLGLDEADACDVLAKLTTVDSRGRLESTGTGEWMYLFKPLVAETTLYLKVVLRDDCIVVSFHEEEDGGHEEDEI